MGDNGNQGEAIMAEEEEAEATLIEDGSSGKNNQRRRLRRRPHNVLLACTGSVATVKGPEMAVRLQKECGANVKIILTRGGANFWNKAEVYDAANWTILQEELDKTKRKLFSSTNLDTKQNNNDDDGGGDGNDDENNLPTIELYHADDEWKGWQQLGDPVLHIDLRNWADLLLVAPLSAHSLAKFAGGLCDDTLSCVVRAWDFGRPLSIGKPILLAPAMNTAMWKHPLTQMQLDTIKGFGQGIGDNDDEDFNTAGVQIIAPQVKTLACGEVGNGAMASVDLILQNVDKVVCAKLKDTIAST